MTKLCLARLALLASAANLAFTLCAAAGTVSGTLVATGLPAHTAFTVTLFKDDGAEAAHISMDQSGFYSVDLPPGHYKAQCTSPAPKGANNTAQYLFALSAPITRNLTLSCG
jgi:hypothetical protein